MVEYLFMIIPRGRTLNSGLLKKEFILLNLFRKFDLYPSSSYFVITTRDLFLLYWITTGQRFDVADIIFRILVGRPPLTSDTVKKSIVTWDKGPAASTPLHAPTPAQPNPPTPPLPPSVAPTEWTTQMLSDHFYALDMGFHQFHTQY
ncbi:uncharacterized protein A4U43_C09F14480 [Asparagus officinalis]|uniref:Uncharacterized protein n=1 Tax=Asparagus officinalis TaxID=4686 RepID=A0A5P1EAM6_ASPOF|nr:uncharacterized protein A4U43_C09F14480 [Asparagus officinalis]